MPEYKVKITVVKNFSSEDVFGEKFHRRLEVPHYQNGLFHASIRIKWI